jgi:hypothetical protein
VYAVFDAIDTRVGSSDRRASQKSGTDPVPILKDSVSATIHLKDYLGENYWRLLPTWQEGGDLPAVMDVLEKPTAATSWSNWMGES